MCFRPPSFEGAFITCPKCGTDIPKDATKCPACGATEDELAGAAMAGGSGANAGMNPPSAPGAPKAPSAPGAPRPLAAPKATGIPAAPSRHARKRKEESE